MSQNRTSGAAASKWGRGTARRIAKKIGATIPRGNSNECALDKSRVVIKCAAPNTNSVGVSYKMLERLDMVVGAFQRSDGSFELRSLTPQQYKSHMRDTASKGASAGKVGIVKRSVFEVKGKRMGRVTLL